MPRVDRSALVMQSAGQMYRLVNDVARYPEFLPGCMASEIIEQSVEQMTAALVVSKGGLRQQFTTVNRLQPDRGIAMSLVDGPFSHLKGDWQFIPLDETACKIQLQLEFEFTSSVAEKAFGPLFKSLTESMVSAFIARAKEVYSV